jgi:SAM-dependent methyltransferase
MRRFSPLLAVSLLACLALGVRRACRLDSRQHFCGSGGQQQAGRGQTARCRPQARGNIGLRRRQARRVGRGTAARRRLLHADFEQGRRPAGQGVGRGAAQAGKCASQTGRTLQCASKVITGDAGYANVTVLQQPLATVSVPAPVDLVFTAQNYHDLHNVPSLDIAVFNKSVFDSLKPGGYYVVLDHSAEAGSEVRDTSTLHRIDEATVKKEVMAAGFEFAGSSNILANAADPRTAKVFDPSIRGKTDQFILKFRKPKK